jgi:hypothetical protein
MVGVRGEGGEEMVSNVAMEVGGGGLVEFEPLISPTRTWTKP